MALVTDPKLIPELWSKELLDKLKSNIVTNHPFPKTFNIRKRRPYGERLLRAAARGEDTSEIERDDPYYTEISSDGMTMQDLYNYLKTTHFK